MTATFLDRSTFIGAYLDDRLIGFAKLHCDAARTQAGLAHILSLIEHRDKSPTNALVARAVKYCAKNGIPNLVYSRFNEGNKQWDSLMEFKDRNGFKRIELPRYYVPLTRFGEIAFQLGLHRRFIDHIPESVFLALRNARNRLYSLKLYSSKGEQG
jgi:hypothetical protein